MIPYALIGLGAALSVSVLYGIDADRALDREQKARAVAEASAKSFAAGLSQCRAEIAERNRFVTDAMSLPEVRKRLCAQRAPSDPCCKAAPKPPAVDECRP